MKEISELNTGVLVNQRSSLLDEVREIEQEIQSRHADDAAKAFALSNKIYGDISFDADGVNLKAAVRKSVKWESAVLREIANELTGDQVDKIFTIKLSVHERTYDAILDDDLLEKINEARTVVFSPIKVSVPND